MENSLGRCNIYHLTFINIRWSIFTAVPRTLRTKSDDCIAILNYPRMNRVARWNFSLFYKLFLFLDYTGREREMNVPAKQPDNKAYYIGRVLRGVCPKCYSKQISDRPWRESIKITGGLN